MAIILKGSNTSTFTSSVSVGGTITYDDVKEVDSVGIITGRSGLHVTSGNLGVGTNNPGNKLVISNAGNDGLEINPTGENSDPAIYSYSRSGDGYRSLTFMGLDYRFNAGSSPSEEFRITSAGNVGIGITNPEKNLVVSSSSSPTIRINNSDGSISADQTIGSLEFKANDGSSNGSQVTGSIESISQAAFTGQGSPSHLIFKTNGVSGSNALTERLRITHDGALIVGDGTNWSKYVSDANFQITDNTNAKLVISNPGNASFSLAVGTSNDLIIRDESQAANRVAIDYTTGNVGIGETVPGARLEVSGGQNQTANTFVDLFRISANANNDGAAAEMQLNFGISASHTSTANRRARIQAETEGGTARELSINPSGGYVGVATDNPGNPFEIHSSVGTNIVAKSTNGNGGYLNYSGLDSSGTTTFSVNHNGTIYTASGLNFGSFTSPVTSKTLDDYEEGVYTVVMADTGSGTITVNSNDDQAQYVKIGNLVTVSGRPLVGSVSSPTGDLTISLPFAPAALSEAAERSPASLYIRLCAAGSEVHRFSAAINDGNAILQLGYASSNDQIASGPRLQAGTQIWFSVTYRTV